MSRPVQTSHTWLLVLALWCAPAARPLAAADEDEAFLKAERFATDTKSLVDFLRARSSAEPVEPAKVDRLIGQLAADAFAERERALQALVALGHRVRPRLEAAVKAADKEVAARAADCLRLIDRIPATGAPTAVVRVLVQRRPPEAVDVLLGYLPFDKDEDVEAEVVYGLEAVGVRDGKVHPSLVRALQDKDPARRAAAACIVGWRGNGEQKAVVTKLLADSAPLVRLRAAQGLIAAREKSGLPTLVALLNEADVALSWQAEELLHWAAGDSAPQATVGAATAQERQRCQKAWQAWHRAGTDKLDLSQHGKDGRRPGLLLLVSESDRHTPGVWLRGCNGGARWQWNPAHRINDVQLLPGNRLLMSEAVAELVERDLQGQPLSAAVRGSYSVCRLPGGTTLAASGHDDWDGVDEVGTDGQFLARPSIPTRKRHRVRGLTRIDRGVGQHLVWHDRQHFVWRDRLYYVWSALRLRNGNAVVMCPSYSGISSALIEVDATGSKVWEDFSITQVPRVRSCLPLVRFGFDNPARAPLGLDSVEHRIKGLKHPDKRVRRISLRALADIGPKAEEAIPAILEAAHTLDGTNLWPAQEALYKVLTPRSLPTLLRYVNDKRVKVREVALSSLSKFKDQSPEVIPVVLRTLKDPDPRIRCVAAGVAGVFVSDRSVACALAEALQDKHVPERTTEPSVASAAARSLGQRGVDPSIAIPALRQAIDSGDQELQPLAFHALGAVGRGNPEARRTILPFLIGVLEDEKKGRLRLCAAGALYNLGPAAKDAMPSLRKILRTRGMNQDDLMIKLRSSVVTVLQFMGPGAKEAIPELIEFLQDRGQPLGDRCSAAHALKKLGPEARAAVQPLQTIRADVHEDRSLRQVATDALEQIQK